MGSGGVLRRSSGGWEFLPRGSRDWDGYHQEIYRNSRGDRLDATALAERGIEIPPLDEYRDRPAVRWQDNFAAEAAIKDVPRSLRQRLDQGGTVSAFVVMLEDGYETSFGDGKYLYPEKAFLDRGKAERFIEEKAEDPDEAKRQWYRYTLKVIPLAADGDRVRADLALEPYEHVSVNDVLRLLG